MFRRSPFFCFFLEAPKQARREEESTSTRPSNDVVQCWAAHGCFCVHQKVVATDLALISIPFSVTLVAHCEQGFRSCFYECAVPLKREATSGEAEFAGRAAWGC